MGYTNVDLYELSEEEEQEGWEIIDEDVMPSDFTWYKKK